MLIHMINVWLKNQKFDMSMPILNQSIGGARQHYLPRFGKNQEEGNTFNKRYKSFIK